MNLKVVKAMGIFGAMIGAAIGGYLSVLKGNHIYTGLGGVIGFIIGYIMGLLLARKKSLNFIVELDKKFSKIDVILSFLALRRFLWVDFNPRVLFQPCLARFF